MLMRPHSVEGIQDNNIIPLFSVHNVVNIPWTQTSSENVHNVNRSVNNDKYNIYHASILQITLCLIQNCGILIQHSLIKI